MLVGYIHTIIAQRRVWSGARFSIVPVCYVGDLRILSGHRRHGIAKALAGALCESIRALGVEFGWCLVNEGNSAALRFLQSGEVFASARIVSSFTTCARLFPWAPRSGTDVFERVDAQNARFDNLLEKWEHRCFSPVADSAQVKAFCATHAELKLYAQKGQREVVFGLWDQSNHRQLALARLPPAVAAARACWNALSRWSGAPSFPPAGMPWTSVDVTLCALPEISREAAEFIAREAFAMGAHTLNVIEPKSIGEKPHSLPGPAFRLRTNVLSLALLQKKPPEHPPALSVEVDLGFV